MADFVLTEDQKFDVASSVGVSVSIIGISEIDLVNSFWTGHVGFKLRVARSMRSSPGWSCGFLRVFQS